VEAELTQKARLRSLRVGLLCAVFFLGAGSAAPVEAGNLQITPPSIEIGAFFNGAEVAVSDVIPRDCEAALEVIGQVREQDLMRMGRRWDIWMNVGEIDIMSAPSYYMVLTSAPQLLGGSWLHAWGYQALGRHVSYKGRHKKTEEPALFKEFIELKQGQGVYGRFPGALTISPLNAKEAMVRGAFRLPSRIRPGSYEVCLNVIKDKQITERRCLPLEVRMAGFPLFLTSLASKYAVHYGFLCVATAVAFGFLSGVFFRKIGLRSKPKGGH
jgi:hypothetical protein